MEFEPVDVGDVEEPDDVDRIALEDFGVGERDAAAVFYEFDAAYDLAVAMGEAADDAGEARDRLRLLVFERSAEDAREVADILGDEEIVLHEALDGRKARAGVITEGFSDLALDIEGQALLGLAGQEVHMAAHRPEKIVGFLKQTVFVLGQHAELDQFRLVAHVIIIFRDPEQRVQVAKPALAFLDIRFDEITRVARLAVALVALGQLGGNEFGTGSGDDFLVEAGLELGFEPLQAADVAHLQDGGADCHVGLGKRDAFLHRAGGMTDLEAHVPEHVEHEFDRLVRLFHAASAGRGTAGRYPSRAPACRGRSRRRRSPQTCPSDAERYGRWRNCRGRR